MKRGALPVSAPAARASASLAAPRAATLTSGATAALAAARAAASSLTALAAAATALTTALAAGLATTLAAFSALLSVCEHWEPPDCRKHAALMSRSSDSIRRPFCEMYGRIRIPRKLSARYGKMLSDSFPVSGSGIRPLAGWKFEAVMDGVQTASGRAASNP